MSYTERFAREQRERHDALLEDVARQIVALDVPDEVASELMRRVRDYVEKDLERCVREVAELESHGFRVDERLH